MSARKPILGISSCLLGEKVRYDGRIGDYQDLVEELQNTFQLVSFCPEVASGLSTPREPMDLFVINGEIRMLTINSKKNITPAIQRVVNEVIDVYRNQEICGFVFKSKSPSCGLRLAKVHRGDLIEKNGIGVFAKAFKKAFPELPVATELDLEDSITRNQFICAVIAVTKSTRKV